MSHLSKPASTATTPLLVVSDLDGTLLDHHSYSWQAAAAALAAIERHNIPLVFNTSKTWAETRILQQRMGVRQPCIVENGAGVMIPADYFSPTPADTQAMDGRQLKVFGTPYADIRAVIADLRREHGFRCVGFGDMSTAEVAGHTGLQAQDAARARQRLFSEPLLWRDSEPRLGDFIDAVRARGLHFTRGGRFIHIMGASDKGRAMLWLAQQYAPPRPRVMALGDGENDIPMLAAADLAVVVRSPTHGPPTWPEDCSPAKDSTAGGRKPLITAEIGPAGWNSAVLAAIEAAL